MPSGPILKQAVASDSLASNASDIKSNRSAAVKAKNLAETDKEYDEVAESPRVRGDSKPPSTENGNKLPPMSASKPAKQAEETKNDMPQCLQALVDAETARLKGNHAYSSGRLDDAVAIYTAADCLLAAAGETEDGQSADH